MKRIYLISLLIITLTACSDRARVNCERTKNKALIGVVTPENKLGAKCQ